VAAEMNEHNVHWRYVVKRFVVFLVFCIALTSCSKNVCDTDEYFTTVNPLLQEWDDATSVAHTTSRIALSPVLSNLQAIKRRTERLEIPECFEDAHSFLITNMYYTIEGFLAFAGDADDATISQRFSLAQTNTETWLLRLKSAK